MSEIPSITKRFIGSGGYFHEIQHFRENVTFQRKSFFPLKSEKVTFPHFSRFLRILTKTPKIPLEISSPNRPGREKSVF